MMNLPFVFSSLLNVILLSNVDRSETWFKNYGCFLSVCNRLLEYYSSLLVSSTYESDNLLFKYTQQENGEIMFTPLEGSVISENFGTIYSLILITLHSIHYLLSNLPRYLFAYVFEDWKKLLISLLRLDRLHKYESEKVSE
jgi:hypothetical protein